MKLNDLYEVVTVITARSEPVIKWISSRAWGPVGSFALLMAVCLVGYRLTLAYFEYKITQAATIQLNEMRWKDLENRYASATDAINLCLSTTQEESQRDWYCTEARNRFRAEITGELSGRANKMLEQQAYGLMLLDLKAATRQIAYERLVFAKPPKEKQMLTQLLRWTWLVIAGILMLGGAWLACLHRYQRRGRQFEDSLPRLE